WDWASTDSRRLFRPVYPQSQKRAAALPGAIQVASPPSQRGAATHTPLPRLPNREALGEGQAAASSGSWGGHPTNSVTPSTNNYGAISITYT
ncbi:MAG: hypothetical protein SFV15_11255, partial [Polyangiaceae bacterium]|nr:hypothetical protein [Polyangiaceae bacterium]